MKDFQPVPFMSAEEMERHKRRMRRTMAVLYAISLPFIFLFLWFALR